MNISVLINPSLSAPEGEVFLPRRSGAASDRAASRPPKAGSIGDPNARGVRGSQDLPGAFSPGLLVTVTRGP